MEKAQGHWRVCSPACVFTPWCVRVRFLAKQTHCILAFALHLYRFSHGQSYFSFSKKIYWSTMGSRMGSKIGSRFGVQKGVNYFVNTRKIHVTCTRMFQLSLSICLSVCLSIYPVFHGNPNSLYQYL